MKGGPNINWNSIIYREKAIRRTEIERLFLARMGFNINLVQSLPLCHVIISNVHVCSFTRTISDLHGRASKKVLRAQNLVKEKL